MKKPAAKNSKTSASHDYGGLVVNIGELLETARRTSVRAVNALMTATYWEVGRRIVEFEQGGEKRAEYGKELLLRLAQDLSALHGKGFSRQNLQNMRVFYLAFLPQKICQTASGISNTPLEPTVTSETQFLLTDSLSRDHPQAAFPLPWSHYVLLTSHSCSPQALDFYHTEALRGGWTIRQLRRQMDSQFYERTALSQNKEVMLKKGGSNKILVRDYLTALPDEDLIAAEIAAARRRLEVRKP